MGASVPSCSRGASLRREKLSLLKLGLQKNLAFHFWYSNDTSTTAQEDNGA
jgi:hypothetical protein